MKSLVGLLAIVLLVSGVASCGGPNTTHSGSSTTTVLKKDRDDDDDNNDDDNKVIYYGHAPTAAERQPIVALVTAYYAAEASADGVAACRLLMPFIAESVVEDIGHSPGLQGKTCAQITSKLFRLHHTLLSGENASLRFYTVRVDGNKALTVLIFANLPEVRQLAEKRDGSGAWKVMDVLDGILE